MLIIDLPETSISSLIRSLNVDDGLVKNIRLKQEGKNARVIVELDKIENYREFALYEPFKIIIDVVGTKRVPVKAGIPRRIPTLPSLFYRVKTIVLDPGHGGRDPGAIGLNGLKEKDINLDIAVKLKRMLEKDPTYEVYLTRTGDYFVPLLARTVFANQKNADLFISIHCNASRKSRNEGGMETYYLGKPTNKAAEILALYENGKEIKDEKHLTKLLKQIKKELKGKESIHFAKVVQNHILAETNFMNRGIKTAPFVVIVGTQMPAVLVELGFISNPAEEILLSQRNFREKLATGLYQSIKAYSHNVLLARVK